MIEKTDTMTTIGYYPGCSLSGGGVELDLSVRALAGVAGVELRQIEDWNCCGATAAHSLNHDLAVALPYRVLALAEEQGLTRVLAPCAACFSRLKGTQVRLKRSDDLTRKMQEIVGRPYNRTVQVLNVVEFVNQMIEPRAEARGRDGLPEKFTCKFDGLKVAAYYGCLLSRGEGIIENDDPERPAAMEAAIRAAGAEPVEWNFATECCGGGFSMSKTDAVVQLSDAILADAESAGAAAIVTGCPMCHSNLDMRQRKINAARRHGSCQGNRELPLATRPHDMPIVYLTELLGLAAGIAPEDLGLNRHFVDATRLAATRRGAGDSQPVPASADPKEGS